MFCVHWARLRGLPEDTGLCVGLQSVFAILRQSTLRNQSFSRETESKDGWFSMPYIWCHRWRSPGRRGHTEVQFEMLLLSFMRFLLISSCPVSWTNVLPGSFQQRELQQTASQQHFATRILLRWGCGGAQSVGGGPAHLWRWDKHLDEPKPGFHIVFNGSDVCRQFYRSHSDIALFFNQQTAERIGDAIVFVGGFCFPAADFTSPILSYWNLNTTTSINV